MKEDNNIGTIIKAYPYMCYTLFDLTDQIKCKPIDGNAAIALELAIEKSTKKIPTLKFLKDEFC